MGLKVTCSRLSSIRFMSLVLWTMRNSGELTFPTMMCSKTLLIAEVMCIGLSALISTSTLRNQ